MKILFTLLVSFFIGAGIAKCQDVPSQLNGYPLTVVMKVQDVSSVINLTSDRQVQFANFFQKELTSIPAAFQADPTGKQATALKISLLTEFRSLLSADELNQYSTVKAGSEYALPKNMYSGTTSQAPSKN